MSFYAASSLTRRAISTATSGIDYKSNGSIGWSNDQFKAGIKSGAVNFALGYAGQKSSFLQNNGWARSGMTSFVNNTLDFNEGGFKVGIRDDNNWGDRFAGAAASASAAYATEKLTNMMKEPSVNTKTPGAQSNGADRKTYTGGITTQEYASHLLSNTVNAGIMSAYNMARYDMSWSQASTTTGFYSGTGYTVSELGGFAGQVLSEGTGRAAIGRQKDEEAKKKAEAEAAKNKSGQNVPPSSAGEGFVNALGAGLIRIKNDLEKLWNGLTGDGFNTNDELKQMEEGKKQAIAAALGEWDKMKTEDLSQDILSNFNADSREVTDAKIQAMRDAKLDTTQIEKQVAVLRQQDAAYKAQLKADSLAQQSAGKETYGYGHDTPINKLVGGSIDAPQTVGGLYYSIPGVDQVKLIPELPTRPNDGSFVDWLAIAPNSVNNVINTAIGIVNGGATEINYLIDNGPSNMMKAYANAFISMKEGVKNAIGNEVDYQTNTPIGQKANDAIDLWSSPGYYETLGTIGLDIAITKGLSTISMPGTVNNLLGSVSRAEKLPMDELSNINKVDDMSDFTRRQLNMLKNDVGYNISPEKYFDPVTGYDSIGRTGTFVTDSKAISDVMGKFKPGTYTYSSPTTTNLERALGLETNSLFPSFRITEIKGISTMSPASPLEGNRFFLGGGKGLPGGAPEIILKKPYKIK